LEDTDTAVYLPLHVRAEILTIPINTGEACYVADPATLDQLRAHHQVVVALLDASGRSRRTPNPNGSLNNITGIVNRQRNVFGLMPHPEHACEKVQGGETA